MKNILIIEDSFTDLEIFISCFLKEGFNVLITRSGEEALKIINTNRPDLVLLDIILPGISGFEICSLLRKKAITKEIPVVFCSVRGSELDKFWGFKQGANAYISKPIIREQLLRTIKRLVA
jgi:DNA-binding response OmpR family regulator